MSDEKLGELLIRENFISPTQLKTAVDFQKKVGGELSDIVVKLGYVKDAQVAQVMAQEQHLTASTIEINASVVDLEALKILPKQLLEKHQVIPLKGDDPNALVLAMSDPNNIAAIEEIQFLVHRMVEPAVAPKGAIRKALNQLDEFLAEANKVGKSSHTGSPADKAQADKLQALVKLPVDRLLRAFILLQVEKGHVSADELLSRAEKL